MHGVAGGGACCMDVIEDTAPGEGRDCERRRKARSGLRRGKSRLVEETPRQARRFGFSTDKTSVLLLRPGLYSSAEAGPKNS
jgi:hypothetical protein